jgi:hypothetical protein
MRSDAERPARDAPNPVPRNVTARGTALLLAAVFAVPAVASYPVPSLAFAAGIAVARYARPIAGHLSSAVRARSVTPICVPGTGVCIGG